MSLCASVSVAADQFRLAETLGGGSDVCVEFERVVPLDTRVMPYLWITGVDAESGLERVRADPDVDGAESIAEGPDGLLVEVDWHAGHPLLNALRDCEASCLEGVGTTDSWRLSLRFPSRDQLAECYRRCASAGVVLAVEQIHTQAWSVEGTHEAVLTETQRETLVTALDRGYFAVPRTTTLQDLADEFGVSDTAISQRIRRGVARLLAAELSEERSPETGVY